MLRRQEIEDRFARHRNEGVEEYQRDDAPRNTISHATDHHPAIGMPDEHNSIEFVMLDGAKHIGDMGIEIDTGAIQMCALANTRERRREYSLAGGPQPGGDALPDPIALPGAVHTQSGIFPASGCKGYKLQFDWPC